MSQDSSANKSLRDLEAEIARTREAISSDVDELSEQLNPERYKAQFQEQTQETLKSAQNAVMESVQEVTDIMVEKSKDASSSVVEMIREHPVPALLVGLGVALLAVGGGVGARRAGDDDFDYEGYTRKTYGGEEHGREGYGRGVSGSIDAYRADRYSKPSGASTGHTGYAEAQAGLYGQGSGLEQGTYDSYSAYDAGYDTGYGKESYSRESYSAQSAQYYGASYGARAAGGFDTGSSDASDSDADGSDDDGVNFAERAGELGGQAKRRARRSGRGLANFIEERPLVAGIITVLAGAAIGMALPGSRKEDELLGGARSTLAGQAKGVAQRAKEVAQKTFEEAKETAKHEFGKHQEGAEKDAQGLLERGKEAAQHIADDARDAAEKEADKQNLR